MAIASGCGIRREAPRHFGTTTATLAVTARCDYPIRPWELIAVESPAEIGVMVSWYAEVLGATPTASPSERPPGPVVAGVVTAWIIAGDAGHRIIILSPPRGADDRGRRRCRWDQHVAFEYATIDDLLRTHARLERLGIAPFHEANSGATTAFYYEDPAGNSVELMVHRGREGRLCALPDGRPPDADRPAIFDRKLGDWSEIQDASGAATHESRRGR